MFHSHFLFSLQNDENLRITSLNLKIFLRYTCVLSHQYFKICLVLLAFARFSSLLLFTDIFPAPHNRYFLFSGFFPDIYFKIFHLQILWSSHRVFVLCSFFLFPFYLSILFYRKSFDNVYYNP